LSVKSSGPEEKKVFSFEKDDFEKRIQDVHQHSVPDFGM
jgi:hypothetical protein